MMMDSRDDEDREYDELDDDSFDNPVLESEIEADLIEEWCPVCREIKPHAVIGNDKIACAACNHEHRREVDAPAPTAARSLLTSEDKSSPEALEAAWGRLTDGVEPAPYSIRLKLSEGDVIKHTKFGNGIVIEMIDSTKAEVLFKDGLRKLVCGK